MFEYTDNINIREIFQKDKQAFRSFLKLPDDFSDLEMDQKNKYHSLNVIEHTFQVIDNINNIEDFLARCYPMPERVNKKILFYAALFHDLGKLDPRSQKIKPDGCMSFYGSDIRPDRLTHEVSSFLVWQNFVKDKNFTQNEIDIISKLIYSHMRPHALLEIKNRDKFRNKVINYNCSISFWWQLFIHAACDNLAKQNTEKIDYTLADPYFDCFFDIFEILDNKNDQEKYI